MKTKVVFIASTLMAIQSVFGLDTVVYTTEDCSPDPNDLDAQSFIFTLDPTVEGGKTYTGCMDTSIGLPDWPKNGDNGKYPEHNDDIYHQTYRQVQKYATPCADLTYLQPEYLQLAFQEKRDNTGATIKKGQSVSKPVRDVTEVQHAPIVPDRRDDECKMVVEEKPYTTFGEQLQIGPVSDKWRQTRRHVVRPTQVGFSEYVSFAQTFESGYSETKEKSNEFSVSKALAPEPGHAGYPTFTPLWIWDSSVQNQPDGSWLMVTTI
ncbi:hypothetical protein GGR57DRAFT_504245 [Xylariaceae sp. FL1272]|nr:hypothetical protein GGR57DRAFT_504245 [Xylariaceae sp. FL1272]